MNEFHVSSISPRTIPSPTYPTNIPLHEFTSTVIPQQAAPLAEPLRATYTSCLQSSSTPGLLQDGPYVILHMSQYLALVQNTSAPDVFASPLAHTTPADCNDIPMVAPTNQEVEEGPSGPSPLAGPIRKRVKVACKNCHEARKPCASSRPCLRCVKLGMGMDCVDRPRFKRTAARGARQKGTDATGSRASGEAIMNFVGQDMQTYVAEAPRVQHPSSSQTQHSVPSVMYDPLAMSYFA